MTEEQKKERGAKFMQNFATSDANQDGLLDFEEYKVLQGKFAEDQASENGGKSVQWSEDEMKTLFEHVSRITPDVNGCSMADFGTMMGGMMRHMKECGDFGQ